MRVRIKLIDIFRDYLPPGADVSDFWLDVAEDAAVADIFDLLGIPADLPRVVSHNRRIVPGTQRLSEGDVIAIFSPVFGG